MVDFQAVPRVVIVLGMEGLGFGRGGRDEAKLWFEYGPVWGRLWNSTKHVNYERGNWATKNMQFAYEGSGNLWDSKKCVDIKGCK